jgi:aryl-alcohol dehydrogenase-like predicted oxidoreductase
VGVLACEDAAGELDASLTRMGLDHVDLIYALPPPEGLPLDAVVDSVTTLITAGKARAWGVTNWPADLLRDAWALTRRVGVAPACATQLPYSVARRVPVEREDMVEALAVCGVSVVASSVLAGGILTGKYDADPRAGRAGGTLDDPRLAPVVAVGSRLRQLAATIGTSAAPLAIAFTLTNPAVASVLFGATTPNQVRENATALALVDTLDAGLLAQLRHVAEPTT